MSPCAIASATTNGCCSIVDGSTSASWCRSKSGTSLRKPKNSTLPPNSRANASDVPRSGPSPTTVNLASAGITPGNAKAATRSGIQAMVPLQATWAARSGGLGTTALLAGVAAVGYGLRFLGRARGKAGVSIT